MANYVFKRVDLPEFTGLSRERSDTFADPASVTSGGPLRFTRTSHKVHCLLFGLEQAIEPNWFGVAIPEGLRDFTSVLLFFHPMPGQPGQVGYDDNNYAGKLGKWRTSLPRYIEGLGFQAAASRKKRVVIMPFLPKRAADNLGVMASDWKPILTGLLKAAQEEVRPQDDIAPIMFALYLASFSVGIKYLHTFMKSATGYGSYLREVYDFDGSFSSDSGHLAPVVRTMSAGVRHVQYDQMAVGAKAAAGDVASGRIHLSADRWAAKPKPDVSIHNSMLNLLCHALSSSPRD